MGTTVSIDLILFASQASDLNKPSNISSLRSLKETHTPRINYRRQNYRQIY